MLLRPLAVAALVALTATACGTVRDVAGQVGDAASEVASEAVTELETVLPRGDGSGDGGGQPATGGQASEGSSGGGTDAEPPASEPAAPGAALTPADDLGRVGANGRAMLRGDRPSLVVEVDVQQGLQPTQASLDHMVAQLTAHADKPGGVSFAGGNTFASDRTAWTASDLRAVASANRSTSTTDQQVSLYVLYVRGGFQADGQETSAVGVTYNASEIAVFPERWSGLGTLVGSDRQVERAVLTHELGHALGLVNLTYDSAIDHEDPEHPGHSRNRGSVMFWAVETDLIGQVFGGPPPDTFDADDAADLEGLRTGRY